MCVYVSVSLCVRTLAFVPKRSRLIKIRDTIFSSVIYNRDFFKITIRHFWLSKIIFPFSFFILINCRLPKNENREKIISKRKSVFW